MRVSITNAIEVEVRALYDELGYLDEDAVLKASKKKSSALHALFLWSDDAAAAAVGRREIARQIIVSVHIEDFETPIGPVTVRAYPSVGDGYRAVEDVIGDREWARLVLLRAFVELRRFVTRYAHLKELSPLMRQIGRTLEKDEGR